MYDDSRLFDHVSSTHSRKIAVRRPAARKSRQTVLAQNINQLEHEHVALLLAIAELEGSRGRGNRALRQALLPLLRGDLRQTQHTLALAARGSYGRCEDCHKTIPLRKLELEPATTFCPSCTLRDRLPEIRMHA